MEKREIHLLENQPLLMRLNMIGIGLFVGILVVGIWWGPDFSIGLLDVLLGLALLVALFLFHEVVHGVFFKLFSPRAKIQFGYAKGMLYAGAPGTCYSRIPFFVIAIMPFIVNSLLLVGFFLWGMNYWVVLFIFACHTSGCIGDFYYVYLLVKAPKGTKIEDTDYGIALYFK
ncbi:DUF3267 domain-containing protein [Listeria costaricensis]|uniref:DUF3267 domain-containing protein n=1 Tax=Listeria costaricensis TaxID=2026604 RepID=UPI0013C4565B|nr:DUF3267 domain-containing protein [Listeria costaricensis]